MTGRAVRFGRSPSLECVQCRRAHLRIGVLGTPLAITRMARHSLLTPTIMRISRAFAVTCLVLVASVASRAPAVAASAGPGVPAYIHHYAPVHVASPAAGTAGTAGGPLAMSFTTLGRQFDVELEPSDLFTADARVQLVGANGVVRAGARRARQLLPRRRHRRRRIVGAAGDRRRRAERHRRHRRARCTSSSRPATSSARRPRVGRSPFGSRTPIQRRSAPAPRTRRRVRPSPATSSAAARRGRTR